MYYPNPVPRDVKELSRYLEDELRRIQATLAMETLEIYDGVQIPGQLKNRATIYIDAADGDLKIKYSDGTVKTIVIDT